FTRARHGCPPSRTHQSSPPPIATVWPALRVQWPLASSGIKALSSLLARSWSRKALRVLRKSTANSAQEFDALISTMRMASMLGRGGSALMRWGTSPDWTQRQKFFFLGRDQDTQIERVHGDRDL